MSRYKISGRRLESWGRQKQSSPGGSDGKCWAEMSPQLRIGAQITRKYARNLLIDVYAFHFYNCNIKKCFWLQFNRSEPCWGSVAPDIVREVGQNIVSVDVNTA